MKFLETLTNHKRKLIFFDLEGAQTTAEIIAIAAVKVTLDAKYNIKKVDEKGFKRYVKSYAEVGKIITRLTGIDDELLAKEGVSYQKAIDAFYNYVGHDLDSCMFVAYGNYDKKMLFSTCNMNDGYKLDFIKKIASNYIDFSTFISKFMRDEKNCILSLSDCVEVLGGTFKGDKHDPMCDTINLIQVYDLFSKNKTLVKTEYRKLICNDPRLPKPIVNVLKKINSGQNVTPKDFEQYIDDYIK